ncbi:glycosyltransferase family 2 protein [Kitasatospora sp. NPDC048540]|uniref:glycosyltransferase family 2 protein n=1 Tax=unclassified Kitasatospora TaxID=2633591 RepID=UPI00068BA2BC|nr:glycosyltransferase family 2 protein [Kitasatospora sp. MBT63]
MSTRRNDAPTLSVVICAYTLDRWADIRAAVASVQAQQLPPAELLLVTDHCPELARRAERELPQARVVPNAHRKGLSGARNTGVAAAAGEVVAFLDDDAVADPQWTRRLLAGYRDPAVVGVGGLVDPWWETGRPGWFPPEFDWVVGCTYHGSPGVPAPVRNFTGANMSFRRSDMLAAGGFRQDLGRVGTKPLGCEETELCLRLAARDPRAELRFEPAARVRHHVPPTRTTWSYFRARCYAEGRSKALVAQHAGTRPALADERRYLRRTVPAAVLRSLLRAEFRTAGTLCAGVGITVLGYTSGRAHSFLAGSTGSARRSVRSPS